MESARIRESFLSFFESKGHLRQQSAPLIPEDDPTILFTIAGMVPLKSYFLGQRTPPSKRLTTSQKCFRTNDIEEVGFTPRHDTFFEMLGNFSFGDYFKPEVIPFAWELLTKTFGLPAERLWPSVHPGDSDALALWAKQPGVHPSQIIALDENFWEMGAGLPGPCGYDSEVHWDLRVPCSCGAAECTPACGGTRWMELWNLVFMEFEQDAAGHRTPLPKPSIDTGMGLERITCVLQDQSSIFDTDLFAPIIERLHAQRANDAQGTHVAASANVCADHARAAAFLIADGVVPANEGRGYVVRRLIRRALLHGRRLGIEHPLSVALPAVVEVMGAAYPELVERQMTIASILSDEEASFLETLEVGVARLGELFAENTSKIGAADAFKLYDTYGFPVDLTTELAHERNVEVDLDGFQQLLTEQRVRSKSSRSVTRVTDRPALTPTVFVGYEALEVPAAHIMYLERDGQPVDVLQLGETGLVVLDMTPFYAEAGGQVGDTGTLSGDGAAGTVTDTIHLPASDAIGHTCVISRGKLSIGMAVQAVVDGERRAQIARHHSATHLLHKTLRELLGDSVVQRGSYVGPHYTTFDFSFPRALTAEERLTVEQRVNAAIRTNFTRDVQLLPIAEARKTGAMALFGEKYGHTVRVVDFGGWARELCGGTHVSMSGDVGAAIIVSESSIGHGIRRIEMVVGSAAVERWERLTALTAEAAQELKVTETQLPHRVHQLSDQLKQLQHDHQTLQKRFVGHEMLAAKHDELIGDIALSTIVLPTSSDARTTATAADELFAGSPGDRRVAVALSDTAIVVKVTPQAAEQISAAALIAVATAAVGGRGGGRTEFAQGSVKDADALPDAIEAIRTALQDV